MKTYRKPGRQKRQPVGTQGRLDPLPVKASVLTAKRGDVKVAGGDAEVTGNHAVAVCRARWGNAYWRRQWRLLCCTHGLGWEKVQDFSEESKEYTSPQQAKQIFAIIEVFGGPEAVALATRSECVASWEYRVKAAGQPATTIGPERRVPKSKPAKPFKRSPFYGVDREVYGPLREKYVKALERECGVKMG